MTHPSNEMMAEKLRQTANLLEVQHQDGYRLAGYRRAAETLLKLDKPIDEIVRSEGLVLLPINSVRSQIRSNWNRTFDSTRIEVWAQGRCVRTHQIPACDSYRPSWQQPRFKPSCREFSRFQSLRRRATFAF